MQNPTDDSRCQQMDWVSVQEAAIRLGIAERTVYARIERGELLRKREDGRTYVQLPSDDRQTTADDPSDDQQMPSDAPTDADRWLYALVDDLTKELKTLREKWAEERERTDAILMQQARTMDTLADENRHLRALPGLTWWQRLRHRISGGEIHYAPK